MIISFGACHKAHWSWTFHSGLDWWNLFLISDNKFSICSIWPSVPPALVHTNACLAEGDSPNLSTCCINTAFTSFKCSLFPGEYRPIVYLINRTFDWCILSRPDNVFSSLRAPSMSVSTSIWISRGRRNVGESY